MGDRCEYEECPEPAEGWIEAQWSVADFVRYEMCHNHLWVAYDEIATWKVDNAFVIEMGVHYYQPA